MKTAYTTASVLLVAGGLSWGLTAFGSNMVDSVLGAEPMAPKVAFSLEFTVERFDGVLR